MKVSFARIAREYRKALIPVGILFAINVVLLIAVVLPLVQRVSANEERAETAARVEALAQAEFQKAEALREGKARATTDLDTFYRQVLPVDVEAARRVVQSKTRRLATAHDVRYERGQSDTEDVHESSLERLVSSVSLSGAWDDLRGFIYELETAPEFIVIDNVEIAEGLDTNAPLALSMELSTYYRLPTARARARANGR
jgi:Tfp pilus assembly protein PilO